MLDSTCRRAQLGGAGTSPSPASSPQCVGGFSQIDEGGTMGTVGLVVESICLCRNSLVPQAVALRRRRKKVESGVE